MESAELKDGVFRAERDIPDTPDNIFRAFSDANRIVKWWGPKDVTNTFHEFDFSTGGRWTFTMHGPDGRDYPNRAVFIELVESQKLVISHTSAPRFTLTVSLKPTEVGTTQLTWLQRFENEKVAESIRHIAAPGNEQNLDRLEMLLRGEL